MPSISLIRQTNTEKSIFPLDIVAACKAATCEENYYFSFDRQTTPPINLFSRCIHFFYFFFLLRIYTICYAIFFSRCNKISSDFIALRLNFNEFSKSESDANCETMLISVISCPIIPRVQCHAHVRFSCHSL